MTIACADARDTGLPPDSFDRVIIMGNSLGYAEEPEADQDILAEAGRVLKKGGRALVDVVNGATLRDQFQPRAWHEIGADIVVCREREITGNRVRAREVVLSRKEGLLRDQTYAIRFYTPASLRRLMKAAGFGAVSVKTEFSPHDYDEDYGCMNNRMLALGTKE
jgi:D-alanine-D-alanine ligase